jgi:hypothetical protein
MSINYEVKSGAVAAETRVVVTGGHRAIVLASILSRAGRALTMVRREGKTGASRPKREPAADVSKGILTRVTAEGLRALKMLAIEQDTTLQGLVVEALNDLLAKYGKRPVVRNPLLSDQ